MPNPRHYLAPPPPVTGYPQDARWAVVQPSQVAIVNIVANPSVETNTTGYTAVGGSIARTTTKQRRGAYGLLVTPTAGVNDGFYYGTVTVTAKNYPWSFDFWGNAGYKYKAYWATTGGVQVGTAVQFVGRGRWQRVQVPWAETSSTTRRLYIVKDNQANLRPFYVDGMLIPDAANDFEEWRYFDGASIGFIPNQVDFYWNGTPHGSTSTMRPNTRAGGRILPFSRYGLTILAMLGANLATPNNVAIPLALPGGQQYQRTLSPASVFTLVGDLDALSPMELRGNQIALTALLDVRRQPVTQPMILQYESVDECGEVNGERVEVVCSFAGGLEGQWDNNYQENLALKFQVHLPYVGALAGSAGAALDVRDSFTAGYIARRDVNGIWSALQTSGLGAAVFTILPLPDGRWLVGGQFSNAGGVADADRLAYYDPASDTFSAVNATPLNGIVYALLLLPDGNVLVGGAFTDAGGFANADYLTLLTVSTGAFSALNATPLNAQVFALALLPTGNVAVGGGFTNAGGDANADFLALLTISTGAYSAFVGTPLNNTVLVLAVTTSGNLYAGGNFTNPGGFADNDFLTVLQPPYTAYSELLGFTVLNAAVVAIRQISDGSVLIGGNFTDVNGDTTWDYLIRSQEAKTGTVVIDLQWTKPFSSISGTAVSAFAEPQPGVNVVGGLFTGVAGVALFDGMFQFSGSTLIPLDVDLPANSNVIAMGTRLNGELIIGTDATGTAYTSGTTTLTNLGSAPSKPIIVITHPTTATAIAPLYSIRNLTTGKVISFNLNLLIGETLTIDLTTNSVTSNLRGNLISTVLPGSNLDSFVLVPGTNVINIFSSLASGSLPSAYMYWTPAFAGLADAGY